MRRISFAVVSTLAALVLMFSYRTSTGSAGIFTAESSAVAQVLSGGTTSPSTSAEPVTTTTTAPAPVVVDGAAARTRYGNVQVEVTITDGKIVDVTAIDYPSSDGRDAQINGAAVPILERQAVAAQGSGIDGVSGATYTSEGFAQSLQSALDAANFSG